MMRRPPRSTLTYPRCPYTTLFRSSRARSTRRASLNNPLRIRGLSPSPPDPLFAGGRAMKRLCLFTGLALPITAAAAASASAQSVAIDQAGHANAAIVTQNDPDTRLLASMMGDGTDLQIGREPGRERGW